VGCEAYKDDSEMEGDHQCPTHKTRCIERQEENYFFALSKYQQQIQVPRMNCFWATPHHGFLYIALQAFCNMGQWL
jgi:hypothetical protein